MGANIPPVQSDALSAETLLGAGYVDELDAWLAPECCEECGEPLDDFG